MSDRKTALLMKSTWLKMTIDAERRRVSPSVLRLLRLNRLKLMLENRLRRLAEAEHPPTLRLRPAFARVSAGRPSVR
jgi:hypothetical protein